MLFLGIDMCMTGVHIHSVFVLFLLEYSNLSSSGGVKICPQWFYIDMY